MTTVWVYAELTPDGPRARTLELLTKARSLGDEVAAVALGPGATAAAAALGEYGAQTVYASDDPVYDEFLAAGRPRPPRSSSRHGPDLILFANLRTSSRDVAGRLQARPARR